MHHEIKSRKKFCESSLLRSYMELRGLDVCSVQWNREKKEDSLNSREEGKEKKGVEKEKRGVDILERKE